MTSLSLPSPFQFSQSTTRRLGLFIWILAAILFVGLFLIDQYSDYHNMIVPCDGTWMIGEGECDWIQVSSTEEMVLQSWGLSLQHYAVASITISIITLIVYLTVGLVILWRMGTTRIGLLISMALVSMPYSIISGSAQWASIHPYLLYPGAVANTIGNIFQITFLYLLPNGRFSPKWAFIPWLTTIVLMIETDLLNLNLNIIPDFATPFFIFLLVGCILLGAVLQIHRYFRNSTPIEKQQTRWILLGILAYVTSIIMWIMVFGRAIDIPAGEARVIVNVAEWYVSGILLMVLPFAIAIAILRYKLWNIDIIINRTLVFGGLSAFIVLLYTLIVGGLSVLFQSSGNGLVSLIATVIIIIIIQPARDRLQQAVNHLMFGERDNPYAVLSRLGQQLQTTAMPSETLKSLVETIASTLKLPYVAIELIENDVRIGHASTGTKSTKNETYPLRYQTELVGHLLVAPRAGDEKFNEQEQQLLADISAQIAPVASATRLTLALQQSREKLVMTREEERRRIRRDLHDGLGPTLASQTLQLDAVLDLLKENESSIASKQVEELKSQTQQMVADIRRLVYELRPPALDELGLLEALRAHVAQMSGTKSLQIAINANPEPLPKLPAAIEVAVYRISLEAVTNVIRHADARKCKVQLKVSTNDQLSNFEISVIDNGIGLPSDLEAGVGLSSMRERTEELGGTIEIKSNGNHGTQLTVNLPFITQE